MTKRHSPLPLAELVSIPTAPGPVRLTNLPLPPTARILFLAPHPDDFDSVAVSLKHFLDRGHDINLVVLTGGAAGVLDSFVTPPSSDRQKDDVREEEQKASLRFFGLPPSKVRFLRLAVAEDGELLVDENCRTAVANIFREVDPDVVFVPYEEDTNSGHRRACVLFRGLASTASKPIWALYHKDPKTVRIRIDVYTPFGAETAEWKRELLRLHLSQHTRNLQTRGSGFDDRILDVNEALAAELGIGEPFAEGFQTELFQPKAKAPASPLRRTLGWLGYLAYLVAFMVALGWLLHYRWLKANRPEHFMPTAQVRGVDRADLIQIGSLKTPDLRRSSFANFAPEKSRGVLRIGCFGDSFTWGTEVADGNDFPAILQERLRALGVTGAEVLNFGSPGFGLHQSYLTWERIGRKFDLDYAVLLGMARYWTSRDTSFTFWNPPAKKLGFHARYVLDGDGLRLVEVVGDTEEERFAEYLRFVPRLRYARYDRKTPAFLQAWLLAGRSISNPFYYRRGDIEQEAFATYERLLERWATQATGFVLLDGTGELARATEELDPPPGRIVRLPPYPGFPYLAPSNHYSPWGNRLVADTFLHGVGLAGKPKFLVVQDVEPGTPTSKVGTALKDAASFWIEIGDYRAASFYAYRRHKKTLKKRIERLTDGNQALLAIPVGRNLLDSLFFPLPLNTAPDSIRVTVEVKGKSVAINGAASDIGGRSLGFIRLDLCGNQTFREVAGVDDKAVCKSIRSADAQIPNGPRLNVRVNGEPLAAAVVQGRRIVIAPRDRYFRVRGDGNRRAPIDALGDTGGVFLAVADANGKIDRIPIAHWRWRIHPRVRSAIR